MWGGGRGWGAVVGGREPCGGSGRGCDDFAAVSDTCGDLTVADRRTVPAVRRMSARAQPPALRCGFRSRWVHLGTQGSCVACCRRDLGSFPAAAALSGGAFRSPGMSVEDEILVKRASLLLKRLGVASGDEQQDAGDVLFDGESSTLLIL